MLTLLADALMIATRQRPFGPREGDMPGRGQPHPVRDENALRVWTLIAGLRQ